MVDWYVYVILTVAVAVSFWTALLEATFLTVRPLSMTVASTGGKAKATKAIKVVGEKTRLVSTTTLLSTFADAILATTTGLVLSDAFGPEGWVFAIIIVL